MHFVAMKLAEACDLKTAILPALTMPRPTQPIRSDYAWLGNFDFEFDFSRCAVYYHFLLSKQKLRCALLFPQTRC